MNIQMLYRALIDVHNNSKSRQNMRKVVLLDLFLLNRHDQPIIGIHAAKQSSQPNELLPHHTRVIWELSPSTGSI